MSRFCTLVRFSAAVALFGAVVAVPAAWADETQDDEKPAAKAEEAKDEEEPDRYAIPEDATVEQLVKFIDELKAFRPSSREEALQHRLKGLPALKEAAERILELEKDPKSPAARQATGITLMLGVNKLRNATPDEKAEFYQKAKEYIANSDKKLEDVSLAMNIGMGLEYGDARDLAGKAYTELGEILAKSDDKAVAEQAQKLIGAGRRMNLVGRPLELTGTTLSGQAFDIEKLKGKVVLVDFWATWCGPCLAEYPNILKNYKAYHDKGFEVVGVSLDADRDRLEEYVDEKDVPWTTLHEKEADGDHPAATHYGIFGIPAVILINKEGNVISLNARGEELGKLLEKELGPAEPKKDDDEKEESK